MNSVAKMATLIPVTCLIFLTLHSTLASEYGRDGIIDKISSGMKYAQDFLGSESVALKVAEFVVRAFQTANSPRGAATTNRPYDDYSDESSSNERFHDTKPNANLQDAQIPMTPLKHLVRLFGLQPNQISAVAVNALVFVAQMISTFLAGPQRPTRPYRLEDPSSWILNQNSTKLQELIAAAKNESLPEKIEDLIKEQGTEQETSCIRLLVCKITPFVNRMQKAVFGDNEKISENVRGAAIMYRHLPSEDEVRHRSDICERQHKDCDLNE